MKVHFSLHLAGVVDVELLSATDMKAGLVAWEDHGSAYFDDEQGGNANIAIQTLGIVKLTAGELLLEACLAQVKEALRKETQDITLQVGKKGGDA